MAVNRIMKYVPFLLVIGILIFSPSAIPLPNVSAAQTQLLNDNNTPASFFGSWQSGHIVGAVLTPEAFMYPVRVLSVDFLLYNGFPGATNSVNVRVCIYAMDNGFPDTQLGCSGSTNITTFDPYFVSVNLPTEIILNSPDSFLATVEYVSGTAGTTPSTLSDSNTNIQQGKNFYSFDGGSTWHEHYEVWTEPDQVGYNIIRATVDTNYGISLERLYIPLVLKDWQSIPPDPPVLNSISNPDGDGSYNVTWNAVSGATSYILEEDDNGAFSNPETAYSGPMTSTPISGQGLGTYYYRVKATNIHGSSAWSNIQSTEVTQEPPAKDWTLQQTGITENLNAVHFIDSLKGWVAGDNGVILYTTDGGQNWQPQTSGTTEDLKDIIFLDANQGWAVGGKSTILRTLNGGQNWGAQVSPLILDALALEAINFGDSQHGWIVGGYYSCSGTFPYLKCYPQGKIFGSTNGGESWSHVGNVNAYPRDVHFANDLSGWLVGSKPEPTTTVFQYPKVYFSSNGGSDWASQSIPLSDYGELYGVTFLDANTGWAVGDSGWILHTTNGGTAWNQQTSGVTNRLDTVRFVSAATGWIVGPILHTTNGGSNWASQGAEAACINLRDASFGDADHGWAVGDGGVVCTYQKSIMSKNELNR